jgi:hypothetical protein
MISCDIDDIPGGSLRKTHGHLIENMIDDGEQLSMGFSTPFKGIDDGRSDNLSVSPSKFGDHESPGMR